MNDGLAVVLHGHAHVGLGEAPRLDEIAEPYAVALADLSVVLHIHGLQDIHGLQLVNVAVDGGLGGAQEGGELLHGPRLGGVGREIFHEQPVGHALADGDGSGLGVVALRQVSDLDQKGLRDDVYVVHAGHRRIANDLELEQNICLWTSVKLSSHLN